MKHLKNIITLALCSTLFPVLGVAAEDEGFYIRGHYDWSDINSDERLDRQGPNPMRDEIEYDTGNGFGAAFGYQGEYFRLELEYLTLKNDIKEPTATIANASEIESRVPFLSIWYMTPKLWKVQPYVGVGLGQLELETEFGDDSKPTYHVGAGLNYPIYGNLELDVGLRYIAGTQYDDITDSSSTNPVGFDDYFINYETLVAHAGLKFNFFSSAPPSDTDGDGVPDNADQCPGTPIGITVDASGCPVDSDNDGVKDDVDQCPNTPRGTTVDSQGCPLDSDQDGVINDRDQCPGTPPGTKVDAVGCPLPLDSDQDGVINDNDECPNTPRGQRVMSNGCAPKQELILKGVNFEFDSARLTENAERILDEVADTLKSSPGFRVELQGHTDARGSDRYNQGLSQRRANSVKTYLVGKGVDGSRLDSRGFGESQPIATNDTDSGRAENRRVVLKVLE